MARKPQHRRDEYAATSATGDRADCGVRALAVAACISHEEARELLANAGREHRQGTLTIVMVRALKSAGFGDAEHTYHANHVKRYTTFERQTWWGIQEVIRPVRVGAPTLGQWLASHAVGHYIVRVSDHLLAVCDGVIHDWKPGLKRRVLETWRLDY